MLMQAPFLGLLPTSWARVSWALDMLLLASTCVFIPAELLLVSLIAPEHMRFDPHPLWRSLLLCLVMLGTALALSVWNNVVSWQQACRPSNWPGIARVAAAELACLAAKLARKESSHRPQPATGTTNSKPFTKNTPGAQSSHPHQTRSHPQHSSRGDPLLLNQTWRPSMDAALLPLGTSDSLLPRATCHGRLTISIPDMDPDQLPPDWRERIEAYLRER